MEQTDRTIAGRDVVLLVVWMGLMTGLVCGVRAWAWERLITKSLFRNDHAIWMTPLAECLTFFAVGSVIWGLTCFLPRPRRISVLVGSLAALGGFSLTWGYLYGWAILMLSLGLAVFTVRTLNESPARLLGIARRVTPLILGGVAVVAVLQIFGQADRGPRVDPSPLRESPNVLMIVWDTVRADSVDFEIGNEHTPNLAELAARGTVFTRAIAPASWTLPTHASLFTGLFPDDHKSNWHVPLDRRSATLAELYGESGYATGGFIANLYYCTRSTGLDRGFQVYRDHKLSLDEAMRHSFLVNYVSRTRVGWSMLGIYDELGRKDADHVTQSFSAWRRRHSGRPLFAFLNYFDAHDPYLPDQLPNGARLTADQKRRMRVWRYRHPDFIPPGDVGLARESYAAQIRILDRHLGHVMNMLRETGELDRTLIVVTGDHGEQFGEHDVYSHGNSVYRSVVHVPLVFSFPGRVPIRKRVERPVSLCDVGKTILDLTVMDGDGPFPGVSLATMWNDPSTDLSPRPALTTVDPHPRLNVFPHMLHSPASKGKQYALLAGAQYLICEGDKSWKLYDFVNDAAEQHDLAGAEQPPTSLVAAQKRLIDAVRSTSGTEFDTDTQTWFVTDSGGHDRARDGSSNLENPGRSGQLDDASKVSEP